jgi:hypothetical protein
MRSKYRNNTASLLGLISGQGKTQGHTSIFERAERFGLPTYDIQKMTRLSDEELVPLKAFGGSECFHNGSRRLV